MLYTNGIRYATTEDMNRTPYTPHLKLDSTGTIVLDASEPKPYPIARCHGASVQEVLANARLFCSAPELLDSLLRISAVCKDGSLPPSQRLAIILDLADLRITKALGHELKVPAISANLNQPL